MRSFAEQNSAGSAGVRAEWAERNSALTGYYLDYYAYPSHKSAAPQHQKPAINTLNRLTKPPLKHSNILQNVGMLYSTLTADGLEWRNKASKYFTVWGKRMLDHSPSVSFIHQSRLHQTAGVLGDSLEVGLEAFGDWFNGNIFFPCDQKQNFDAVMIRNPLKVPLHLFRSFRFTFHTNIIHPTTKHSNILQNVGMFGVESLMKWKGPSRNPVESLPANSCELVYGLRNKKTDRNCFFFPPRFNRRNILTNSSL